MRYTWPNSSSFNLSAWDIIVTITRRWAMVGSVRDSLSLKNTPCFDLYLNLV